MVSVGKVVKVFGSRVATVVAVSSNGKRVEVAGDYSGWTNVSNVKVVTV
jgi:hypothetical protein